MSEVYKFGEGVEAKILYPEYSTDGRDIYENRFGLVFNDGGEMTHEQVGRLIWGADRIRFWNWVESCGFASMRVEPGFADYQRSKQPENSRFLKFINVREKLNTIWHRDLEDFALFSEGGRDQNTAISSRSVVVKAFFENIEILVRNSPELSAQAVELKKLFELAMKYRMLYGNEFGDDEIGKRLSGFIFNVSSDLRITDQDIFDFQKSLDLKLEGFQHVHEWKENSVLVVSRWAFHQRVCGVVEDVSDENNALLRKKIPIVKPRYF
ncbi:MAG: hypothetical protein NTZ25_05985 [Candidatus Peregrinibacteria bacterium]|nr:hypothetical protein [Candidatus Peregrinibacteria bacterium]